ncbi:hypothetical protein AB0C29_02215 [Actinoplanes sp. NPDC048791]|uniref:hypothetical protein n=1 Tax=Actinoplanes sp. NPDC048791 TaxID=3154623 RepID=UPI003410A49F
MLAFDFGSGRAGASFADLVELLAGDVPVLEVMPPDELDDVDRPSSVDARLRLLTGEIAANGFEVAVVIGYCAGAALAQSVSVLLGAARQPAPHVVLVDPETVDRMTLLQAYETSLASLQSMDRSRAGELTRPPGWTPNDRDLVQDARLLLDSYVTTVAAAFARMRLPAKLGVQLGARFHRYLAYLVMSGLSRSFPAARPEILASSGYVQDALFPGELRRLDVNRDGMLASPAVAEAVRRAVEAHESTPRPVATVGTGDGRC